MVLVDTLSPWDKEPLLAALASEGFRPEDVTHLVRFCSCFSLPDFLVPAFLDLPNV